MGDYSPKIYTLYLEAHRTWAHHGARLCKASSGDYELSDKPNDKYFCPSKGL